MRIAPAGSLNVAEEQSRGLVIGSPRLRPLGHEQEAEAVELLADLLVDAARREHVHAATSHSEAVAAMEVGEGVPRAA
jgi:hypothetical protein